MPLHRTSGGGETSVYTVQRGSISKAAGTVLIGLVAGYKYLISPLLPSACRFYPTCSVYMREAIAIHGPGRGVWLGLRRLARCHPFHEGGFDTVPPNVAQEMPPQ